MTSIAYQLLKEHLLEGELRQGEEIKIKIDQTLTQDSTGTMVYLQLEAMAIDDIRTELPSPISITICCKRALKIRMIINLFNPQLKNMVSYFQNPVAAFATKSIWNNLPAPVKRWWEATPTRRRQGASDPSPSAPAVWTWPWPWRAVFII